MTSLAKTRSQIASLKSLESDAEGNQCFGHFHCSVSSCGMRTLFAERSCQNVVRSNQTSVVQSIACSCLFSTRLVDGIDEKTCQCMGAFRQNYSFMYAKIKYKTLHSHVASDNCCPSLD